MVSPDWSDEQSGEMLVIIDNSAWPEALYDDDWT